MHSAQGLSRSSSWGILHVGTVVVFVLLSHCSSGRNRLMLQFSRLFFKCCQILPLKDHDQHTGQRPWPMPIPHSRSCLPTSTMLIIIEGIVQFRMIQSRTSVWMVSYTHTCPGSQFIVETTIQRCSLCTSCRVVGCSSLIGKLLCHYCLYDFVIEPAIEPLYSGHVVGKTMCRGEY